MSSAVTSKKDYLKWGCMIGLIGGFYLLHRYTQKYKALNNGKLPKLISSNHSNSKSITPTRRNSYSNQIPSKEWLFKMPKIELR